MIEEQGREKKGKSRRQHEEGRRIETKNWNRSSSKEREWSEIEVEENDPRISKFKDNGNTSG